MRSYASVERFEGKFVVCEVEKLEISDSKTENFFDKTTFMSDINIELFSDFIVAEGDIFVVEHENENVSCVYYKDEFEKQRRVELMNLIMR